MGRFHTGDTPTIAAGTPADCVGEEAKAKAQGETESLLSFCGRSMRRRPGQWTRRKMTLSSILAGGFQFSAGPC